jgi:hypothetical protein
MFSPAVENLAAIALSIVSWATQCIGTMQHEETVTAAQIRSPGCECTSLDIVCRIVTVTWKSGAVCGVSPADCVSISKPFYHSSNSIFVITVTVQDLWG